MSEVNPYATPGAPVELPPTTSDSSPPANPHVLWRQVLGFVLWAGLLSFAASGPLGAVLSLALGGVTFADAWKSGIYKHPDKKSFLNISPMSWAIVMALLFIVAYPTYLLNRNKLRTRAGTNAYFWATVVLGALVIGLLVLNILGAIALRSR
jgi:hypothetical protein